MIFLMTFEQMVERVFRLLGQPKGQFYSETTEVPETINEAQVTVAVEGAGTNASWTDQNTQAGKDRYPLDIHVMQYISTEIEDPVTGERTPLVEVRLDEFMQLNRGLPMPADRPAYVCVQRGAVDPGTPAAGELLIKPVPTDNGGNNWILRHYFYRMPDKLVESEDVCTLPGSLHLPVCFYAATMLAISDGDDARRDINYGLYLNAMASHRGMQLRAQRKPGGVNRVVTPERRY